jgi:hypothetical protein
MPGKEVPIEWLNAAYDFNLWKRQTSSLQSQTLSVTKATVHVTDVIIRPMARRDDVS